MRRPSGAVASGVRSSSITYIASSNTAVIALPAGCAVGDRLVMYLGHSWDVYAIDGVSPVVNWIRPSGGYLTGSNYNGTLLYRTATSGDVAAGQFTVTFFGAGAGIIELVAFIGATSGLRDIGATRNGSGAASRTVTSGATVAAGDFLLLFGSAYLATSASSSSLTSTLQSSSNANASGICRYGVAGSSGAQSGTVGYGGSPAGDYQVIVAFAP